MNASPYILKVFLEVSRLKKIKDYITLDVFWDWFERNKHKLADIYGVSPDQFTPRHVIDQQSDFLARRIINPDSYGQDTDNRYGFDAFEPIYVRLFHDIFHHLYEIRKDLFKKSSLYQYSEQELVEELEILALESSYLKYIGQPYPSPEYIHYVINRLMSFVALRILIYDLDRLIDIYVHGHDPYLRIDNKPVPVKGTPFENIFTIMIPTALGIHPPVTEQKLAQSISEMIESELSSSPLDIADLSHYMYIEPDEWLYWILKNYREEVNNVLEPNMFYEDPMDMMDDFTQYLYDDPILTMTLLKESINTSLGFKSFDTFIQDDLLYFYREHFNHPHNTIHHVSLQTILDTLINNLEEDDTLTLTDEEVTFITDCFIAFIRAYAQKKGYSTYYYIVWNWDNFSGKFYSAKEFVDFIHPQLEEHIDSYYDDFHNAQVHGDISLKLKLGRDLHSVRSLLSQLKQEVKSGNDTILRFIRRAFRQIRYGLGDISGLSMKFIKGRYTFLPLSKHLLTDRAKRLKRILDDFFGSVLKQTKTLVSPQQVTWKDIKTISEFLETLYNSLKNLRTSPPYHDNDITLALLNIQPIYENFRYAFNTFNREYPRQLLEQLENTATPDEEKEIIQLFLSSLNTALSDSISLFLTFYRLIRKNPDAYTRHFASHPSTTDKNYLPSISHIQTLLQTLIQTLQTLRSKLPSLAHHPSINLKNIRKAMTTHHQLTQFILHTLASI